MMEAPTPLLRLGPL